RSTSPKPRPKARRPRSTTCGLSSPRRRRGRAAWPWPTALGCAVRPTEDSHGAKRLLILGSTGSIGTQALEVCAGSEEFELVGLSAERSWESLVQQARAHGVDRIALTDEDMAARAAAEWSGGEGLGGATGLVRRVVESGADLGLNGLVGSPGLRPP